MLGIRDVPRGDTGLIYAVVNVQTGRRYIGSSVSSAAGDRFQSHRWALKLHRHRNQRLQADWDAFGESAFRVFILESGIQGYHRTLTMEHWWIAMMRQSPAGIYNRVCPQAEARALAKALGVEPEELVGVAQ